MNANLIKEVTANQIKTGMPNFHAGDTVKVFVKIMEGGKERIQPYEGVVIARRGEGTSESFIVRKMSGQIGVERCFMLNSPVVEKIEVLKRGRVRRAKIYYMRKLSDKAARIKEVR